MRAIGKRMLLLFICIIAMLSSISTVAHASWTGSFGGAGGSGTVGSGYWLEAMQGIRITIMTPDGQPAFYFGDRDPYVNYLDILYTDKNTTGITAMFGSSKGINAVTGGTYNVYAKAEAGDRGNLVYVNGQPNDNVMGNGNYAARAETEACIVSFEWYNQWVGEQRWMFLKPTEDVTTQSIQGKFNSIAGTLPIKDMGEVWKRNGEQIGKWLYNTDTEAKKPADTAAIHMMFNIYNLKSDSKSPLWHLTGAGEALFSPEMVSAYEAGLSRTAQGLHVYRTTELMELGNMAIVVEPIIWAEIRNYGGQRSGMMLYGTPTNVADGIREAVQAGVWTTKGWEKGGWDVDLHRASRSSFVLSKDVEYAGVTYKVPYDATASKPDTHDPRINQKDLGYAMHIYICGGNNFPDIPTYNPDDPTPEEPHTPEDPDPNTGKIPLMPGENPNPTTPEGQGYQQTSRKINIVKVYDIEKLDGTIEHVETTAQRYNPVQISIQHEPSYKVVGWFTSPIYEGDLSGWDTSPDLIAPTTWEQVSMNPSIPQTDSMTYEWDAVAEKEAGTQEAYVKLGMACDCNPTQPELGKHYNDTTLYVHLLLKEEPIETHTYDPPNSPGSAPDPRDPDEGGPLTPQEEEQLKFNIVKVYETMDEEGNITTDAVYDRPETAGIILIEDEKDEPAKYELIEWHYSTQHKYPSDWNDALNVSPILGSGRSPGKVDIRNPADIYEPRTLYVRLQRQLSEELVDGDIIIQQSQISKAVHTDDTNIGGRWGNYEFVASIGTFQLTHTAYYDHGCCGSCDPPCGSCHGHTCKLEMPGRSGDNKLNFVFDQIGGEESLQVKTGVHSDTDPKVYIPNGQHPETIGSMYASDNVYEYVSDGNQKNGAELVTVLWRGGANPTDIPTLAKYKQTDIQNRYGSANWQIPQAMLKNASNTSHKTRATGPSVNSLSITFGIDQGASDLYGTASCVTHNGYNCIYTNTKRVYMIAGTEFDYDFNAQVAVQFYAGTPKGLQAQPFGGPSTTVMKQEDTSGPHYENTIIQGKQQIKFYPYIKMTYMTNSLKLAELEEANTTTYVNKTRYETYVLSEWESSILPSDAVEVGWKNNNEGESLMLTSQQWSLHQKAVNGGQAWNGANQVLPGGAIYQLSTPSNNLTTVDLVTYQTVVDQKTRQYLSSALSGDEYTEAKVAKDHTDFVNDVKETIDNLRIVQWVNKDFNDSTAWPLDWAENPGDGSICVRGGGESLNELGLPGVTSSETKYYMHKAAELLDYQSAELKDITKDIMSGSQETASEGDLDIISLSNTTTVFKVFTDTAGNVYMASVSSTDINDPEGTVTSLVAQLKDVNADTVQMGQTGGAKIEVLADRTVAGGNINSVLSGDAKQIDDRTKFITNIVSSLTRNRGTDKTAAWATNDGNWYNEAFDGIYLVRQATKLQVGLLYSNIRTSALDPALCPANVGTSDLYSNAFLSQFCLNDKSDATIAADKDERYIGTFKDTDIVLPDMEGMYQSRKFYIPNANVQDLY